MRTSASLLLATACLVGALPSSAQAPARVELAAGVEAPVAVVSPRPGATLAAGSLAELEWRPLAAFARLDGAEEWEAFVSLDGGRSYPFRITPHLDRELTRTVWQVPALPSADVRILLRFGDEDRETAYEVPQRFAIASAAGAGLNLPARPRLAFHPGEPARSGDEGVLAWVEGSRRGAGLSSVELASPPGLRNALEPPDGVRDGALLAAETAPPAAPPPPVAGRGAAVEAGRSAATTGGPAGRAAPILLLIQRRNE